MSEEWESIEAWAKAHGLTLDDALSVGVSQNDDGAIHIPRELWKWLVANDRVPAEELLTVTGDGDDLRTLGVEQVRQVADLLEGIAEKFTRENGGHPSEYNSISTAELILREVAERAEVAA